MNLNELENQIKELNTTVLSALIAASVAFLVGIFNLIVGVMNFRNQKKALIIQSNTYSLQSNSQANAKITSEISSLQKQLEEFYIPFNSYLSQSYGLYSHLRANLPTEFRALIYLIDNDYVFKDKDGAEKKVSFNEAQKQILNELIAIEEKLKDLVINKEGLINDNSLLMAYAPDSSQTDVFMNFDPNRPQNLPKDMGLLDIFLVHITLIKLAQKGVLEKGNINSYKDFVYPRELNTKIKANIISIKAEISSLKQQIR
jgi:hypothetical protein